MLLGAGGRAYLFPSPGSWRETLRWTQSDSRPPKRCPLRAASWVRMRPILPLAVAHRRPGGGAFQQNQKAACPSGLALFPWEAPAEKEQGVYEPSLGHSGSPGEQFRLVVVAPSYAVAHQPALAGWPPPPRGQAEAFGGQEMLPGTLSAWLPPLTQRQHGAFEMDPLGSQGPMGVYENPPRLTCHGQLAAGQDLH